jgi:hypothetical protein
LPYRLLAHIQCGEIRNDAVLASSGDRGKTYNFYLLLLLKIFRTFASLKEISHAKDENTLQCQEAIQAHWIRQDQAIPGKDIAHDAQ